MKNTTFTIPYEQRFQSKEHLSQFKCAFEYIIGITD
jgi:hypothetical protein